MKMIEKYKHTIIIAGNRLMLVMVSLFFVLSAYSQNITKPNIIGPGGVRVNSYTGNMFYQRTDFRLAGRMPIEIAFSYNSADRNRNQGFGRGWTFSYGMHVTEDTGSVTIIRNDGRKDKFIINASTPNILIPPKGIFDSLIKTGSGTYYLRSKDGIKYFFANANHKQLTRYEDRNGNALNFVYTNNLITQIADDAGRTVQLNYTEGNLTSVVEANGPSRTWTYQYDNQGNMIKVTDPMTFTMQYGYIVNGPMNTVQDRNGNVVDVVYNGNFAVKEIISCMTRQTINYSPTSNTTFVTDLVGGANQLTSYKFDAGGNLIQKTGACCGYNVKYEYDQYKNISKLTDANGNVYTYTYDGNGNMLSETDPLGHSILYTYEPVYHQVASVTDKNGNPTTFSYDTHGNLLQINKPMSISENFAYAANGDVSTFTDARGNATSFIYNSYGNLAQVNRPLGSATNFIYDSKGRLLTETDPLIHSTNYAYDSLDRLRTVTDALNHASSFTYDQNGNVLAFTDANNHTTLNGYDALDRLVRVTNALGKSRVSAYDTKGNLLSLADENENTTSYIYDNSDRLIVMTNALGEATAFTYDQNGNATVIVRPNGNNVTLTYDDYNRLIKSSDAIGTIATYVYDNNGNRTSFTDGNGNTTSYSYDKSNRLTLVTDALGHSSSTVYDKNNNITSYTDKNNHITTNTYDALNRQIATTDPLNNTTSFVYDLAGNLLTRIDAKNHTTSYIYNGINQRITETYANNKFSTFTYDAIGNLITRIDPNGIITSLSYDPANRLLMRDYPGANDDVFTYDDGGRKITANNADATITFTYDAVNRLKSETLNSKTISYEYDVAGKKKILHYPGGRTIENKYDERNRLTDVNEMTQFISKFVYDPANRNVSSTYQNGTVSTTAFDVANRITSIVSNPGSFQQFSYVYDNEGNKLIEKKTHNPGSSEQYIYDNGDRLLTLKKGTLTGNVIPSPTNVAQFDYDGVGNRNTANVDGAITNYTSDAVNEYVSLSGATTATPAYDNNGNLTSNGTYNFNYDAKNKTTSINSGTVATYKYDALGRRIKKITGSNSVSYFYSGNRIVEERNNADAVVSTYVYGSAIDQVLTMNRNGTTYFYHYNNLGSVTSITNAAGSVIERYQYDAYGYPKIYDNTYTPLSASSIGNSYYFSGRQFDPESATYYYRNRDFDPIWGRFIQRDPTGYIDGSCLYEYASSNPTNFVDPFGLETDPPGVCKIEKHWNPYLVVAGVAVAVAVIYLTRGKILQVLPFLVRRGAVVELETTGGLAGAESVGAAGEGLEIVTTAGRAAEGTEVSVYHGSTSNASEILQNGLRTDRTGYTYATTDLRAAEDAIGPNRLSVEGAFKDPGIIKSRIPASEFNSTIAPRIDQTPYQGFTGGNLNSAQIKMSPEAIAVFNKYIVR